MGEFKIGPIRLVVRTPGFHPGNRSSILLWATNFFWPIRLVVRTPGFHPGNRSSILLWATRDLKTLKTKKNGKS